MKPRSSNCNEGHKKVSRKISQSSAGARIAGVVKSVQLETCIACEPPMTYDLTMILGNLLISRTPICLRFTTTRLFTAPDLDWFPPAFQLRLQDPNIFPLASRQRRSPYDDSSPPLNNGLFRCRPLFQQH